MSWGQDGMAEWLQEVATERGEADPRALIERPEVPAHLGFVWRAFWDLIHDRPLGFGAVGGISFMAIDRYAERSGILGGDEFERLFLLIRALDSEYIQMLRRKPSDSSAK